MNPQKKAHLNEIHQNGYKATKLLGKGSFGKVYKVFDSKKNVYAVKAVKRTNPDKHNYAEEKVLTALKGHPFIIHLVDSFAQNQHFYFVLELLQENLRTILKQVRFFSECDAAFYMKEIILGVEYLHYRNIIYHDLKLENILVDENGHVRLADFGLSEEILNYEPSSRCCGTPKYMAPEILNKSGHGKEVDWWSLGVMFYAMVTGEFPFLFCDDILAGKYVMPKKLSSGAKSLIKKLLKVKPYKRLGSTATGAATIRNHKFFKKTCWIKVLDRLEVPPFKPVIDDGDKTKKLVRVPDDTKNGFSARNKNNPGDGSPKSSSSKYDCNVSCNSLTETAAYLIHKSILRS